MCTALHGNINDALTIYMIFVRVDIQRLFLKERDKPVYVKRPPKPELVAL